MISLSAFSSGISVPPVCRQADQAACSPRSRQSAGGQPSLNVGPAKDEVKFGWWGGYYPYAGVDIDGDAYYFTGFTPDQTVKEMFKPSSSGPLAVIIASQADLDRLWPVTGLSRRDKPKVDWKKEVILLTAMDKTNGIDAKPKSISYNRYRDVLDVTLPKETKPGRHPGVAWYIGKISNGAASPEEQRRNPDWDKITAKTRVYVRTVSDD